MSTTQVRSNGARRGGDCVVNAEPQLGGQTVVVIGGSSGIRLETARVARAEGADVILTARNADRLHRVGLRFRSMELQSEERCKNANWEGAT